MIDAVFATPVYKSDNLYKLNEEQLQYLKTLEMIKNKGGNYLTTRKDIMDDKLWKILNIGVYLMLERFVNN